MEHFKNLKMVYFSSLRLPLVLLFMTLFIGFGESRLLAQCGCDNFTVVDELIFFEGFEGGYGQELPAGASIIGQDVALFDMVNGTGGLFGSPSDNAASLPCDTGEEQCEASITGYPFVFTCSGVPATISGNNGLFYNSCNDEPNIDADGDGNTGELICYQLPLQKGVFEFSLKYINIFGGNDYDITIDIYDTNTGALIISQTEVVDGGTAGTLLTARVKDLAICEERIYDICLSSSLNAFGSDILFDDFTFSKIYGEFEGTLDDKDEDGIPDNLDADSDNDGIPNSEEIDCNLLSPMNELIFFEGFEGGYGQNLPVNAAIIGQDVALYDMVNGTGGQFGSPFDNGIGRPCDDGEEQCEASITPYPFIFSCSGVPATITGNNGFFYNSCNDEPNIDADGDGVPGELVCYRVPLSVGEFDFSLKYINIFGGNDYNFTINIYDVSTGVMVSSQTQIVDGGTAGTLLNATIAGLQICEYKVYDVCITSSLNDYGSDILFDDFTFTQVAGPQDTDGDGIADYLDLDSDNDGIPDAIEACGDISLVLDQCSLDADNSETYTTNATGCNTGLVSSACPVAPVDTDNDGTPDYLDLDSDGDGCADNVESGTDGSNTSEDTYVSAPIDDCGLLTTGISGICPIPVNENWTDATEAECAELDVVKSFNSVAPVSGMNGVYDLSFTVSLTNSGTVNLLNLSLWDDLASQLMMANPTDLSLQGAILIGGNATIPPSPSTMYTGGDGTNAQVAGNLNDLFVPQNPISGDCAADPVVPPAPALSILEPGQTVTATFTIRVDNLNDVGADLAMLENQATGSSIAESIDDPGCPAPNALPTSDDSDNHSAIDPDNPNIDEDDPTPIAVPGQLELTKGITAVSDRHLCSGLYL